ncbi:cation transporter [Aliifodinibius salipaludis]|uniref:Cation transporter n=1 Tax=Fodinibius salipaludis TaxID=2032627 RepID=A0A2A2GCI3_9BACT|nr:TrkH family potassium uptake protein [Aliifodinibius salipaludis]PAU94890.1 cation transporter [Aliifodinibius salipaludis]
MNAKRSQFRTIIRDVGSIQLLIGPILLIPGLVSMLYGETYSAFSFGISSVITTLFGGIAYQINKKAESNGQSQAMMTAAAAWMVTSFFGALPFFIAAHITPVEVAQSFVPAGETYSSSLYNFKSFLHALFESVSSYTTTGLTMSVHEPSVGYGLLFYRSFAQWLGGAGMIVLSLAILRHSSGMHGLALYNVEASGQKIRPNVRQTTQAIWKVYLTVTSFSALYIFVGTWMVFPDYNLLQNLFEAVNHAMTGQSTGGFSTFDDSISGYGSYAMEMIYLLPMLLGAISIPLYYKIYEKGSLKELWLDYQGRWLILLNIVGSTVLIIMLMSSFSFSQSFREGIFQFISALTTTGWQTADLNTWPVYATLLMASIPMIIGGSTGATVGGIKIFRAYFMAKGFTWKLKKVIQPSSSIISVKLGTDRYPYKEVSDDLMEAYVYSMLYFVVLLGGIIISAMFMGENFQLIDAIFESVSAQGTVGLSSGLTSPSMHPVTEITYIIQMLVGRLELIPILIMLRSFFKHSKI